MPERNVAASSKSDRFGKARTGRRSPGTLPAHFADRVDRGQAQTEDRHGSRARRQPAECDREPVIPPVQRKRHRQRDDRKLDRLGPGTSPHRLAITYRAGPQKAGVKGTTALPLLRKRRKRENRDSIQFLRQRAAPNLAKYILCRFLRPGLPFNQVGSLHSSGAA